MIKLISWNVNGLRACINKGFEASVAQLSPDILCLQETKLSADTPHPELAGYRSYYLDAQKKGYSGTALFTRVEPQSVAYGIGCPEHDQEGRVITARFDDFTLVNVYTPNAQRDLARIDYRIQWEDAFRSYVSSLDREAPVVICGDMNVAHQEIDLKNPGPNKNNAGFSPQERAAFGRLLDAGFIDTFRYFYPDKTGAYSWWSYMFSARKNNAGWRIDYFLASQKLESRLQGAAIHSAVMGSDHCPVELTLEDAAR